jgi:hypothetical protein
MLLVTAVRFLTARTTRRRLVTRRLDAAERAAEFVNLALVGDFLALGKLHEFENRVKLINGVFERLGNLGGVRDSLADGRGFRRAKIGGFDPWLRARRFRAAVFGPLGRFRAAFAFRFRLRFRRGRNFRGWFSGRVRNRLGHWLTGRIRNFFRWRNVAGFFGMRLAEVAGGVGFGLGFRDGGVNGGFFHRFRRRGNFLGGGNGRFSGGGTRTAATAAAPATAAAGRAARGGGQI